MKKLILLFLLIFQAVNINTAHAGVLFDKVDDRIDLGTSNTLMPNGSAITMYARIKPTSSGENNDGRIWARLSTTGFIMGLNNASTPYFLLYSTWSGTDTFRESNLSGITFGAWASIVSQWDGSATATNIKHFKDGAETTYTTTQSGTGSADSNSGQNTLIGNDVGLANTFDGPIGEVAEWSSTSLTAQDHLNLEKSGVKRMALQIQPSSLKVYLPMDECGDGATCSTASMFRDMSGNGFHGSPAGSPVGAAESTMSYP